ncbi:hypothetical protein KI688_001105 [Linnemannia hyalina]|uniref:Phosphoglycerate mutase-like protein n=1 Tax=Linnemannia hyalina TaxID=64524 RepID=A0A9P8BZ57_9FUNG|nr:hypothetical protein KI688_001105 [Linnemannia hyalina]
MPNISLYFVRHGQRIDQVDSSWATTSPCPQDPPLTQLGKRQARQTGTMIRDFAHESSSSSLSSPVSVFASVSAMCIDDNGVKMAKVSASGIQTENGGGGGNKDEDESVPQQQRGQGGSGGGRSDNESSATAATTTLQGMTPPESPDLSRAPPSTTGTTPPHNQDNTSTASSTQQGQGQDEEKATRRVSGPSTFSSSSHMNSNNSSSRSKRRPHHFAIVTSPFLRCSQTAIEMAIGMRSLPATVKSLSGTTGVAETKPQQQQQQQEDGDAVTIAVETGLSGKLTKTK